MNLKNFATTTLFVLLWSSGTLSMKIGLGHGSPFALLLARFALAVPALWLLSRWLPLPSTRREWAQAFGIGLLLVGLYPIFYMLALHGGLSPGLLATLMGLQPLLTALWLERDITLGRLCGLLLGLSGLTLVVIQGLTLDGLGWGNILMGLAALAAFTVGTLLQKRSSAHPLGTLPLQYTAGALFGGLIGSTQPLAMDNSLGFWLPALYMGLVVSVGASLLLYRLIASGNLVNVTSLFYLVPPATAALDWLLLGHAPGVLTVAGMGLVVMGLVMVFRPARVQAVAVGAAR